jgi:hypothetical protein
MQEEVQHPASGAMPLDDKVMKLLEEGNKK